MNRANIMVVEDDGPVRNLITMTLKAHDYGYVTASTGEGAINTAASVNHDIILLDLGLPDIDEVRIVTRSTRLMQGQMII